MGNAQRTFRLSLDLILVALAISAIFFLSINSNGDFDTGYHLRNGEFIVTQHSIPTHDIFSYTAIGALWINHYWLSDVFFYIVYRALDNWGLIVVMALLSATTYLFVFATTFLKTKSRVLAAALIIPYGILTYELWVVRPQTLTYLFTAVTIYILEKWRVSGKERILLALPVLFFLWGNIHAGVLMGVGIVGLYFLNELFVGKDREKKSYFAFTSGASVVATLLNPSGYKVLAYNSIISGTATELGVQEWKSLLAYLGSWQANSFFLLMILVFCFSLYSHLRDKNIDWPAVGLLFTAVALPLISIRHVGFFPILTFPIFLRSIEKNFPRTAETSGSIPRIAALIFLAFLVVYGAIKVSGIPAVNARVLPVGAVQFITDNNIRGPVFNDGAFGGYLVWQKWPKDPVFIDGRNDVYAGETVNDYLTIMRASPGWENLVNQKYRINYFILSYQSPLYDIVRNLTSKLEGELGFKLVYWDDVAIILVRPDTHNQDFLKNFSYAYIGPFVAATAFSKADRPKVVEEWNRAMSISPDSQALRDYLPVSQ